MPSLVGARGALRQVGRARRAASGGSEAAAPGAAGPPDHVEPRARPVTVRSGRSSTLTRALGALPRAGGPGLRVAHELERVRAIGLRGVLGDRKRRAEDQAALKRNNADAYRRIWCDAAAAVGAAAEDLGEEFFLIHRGEAETLVQKNLTMLDTPVSVALANDKSVMQRLLRKHDVPVTEQVELHSADIAVAADHVVSGGGRWVVKPARDTGGGYGVTCGVETVDDLRRAWLWAARIRARILLEHQVDGEEYRLLFLDGEFLDAVHRGLPTVTGDGRSTVGRLIEDENERRRHAGPGEVGRDIKVDLDCELALRRAGLSLHSVAAAGRTVAVKGNVGDNRAAENTTARALSPDVIEIGRRAAGLARLRLAGIDLVVPEAGRSVDDAPGVVLEVNGTPGIQHHYLVDDPDRATPVATMILERIFSDTPPAAR